MPPVVIHQGLTWVGVCFGNFHSVPLVYLFNAVPIPYIYLLSLIQHDYFECLVDTVLGSEDKAVNKAVKNPCPFKSCSSGRVRQLNKINKWNIQYGRKWYVLMRKINQETGVGSAGAGAEILNRTTRESNVEKEIFEFMRISKGNKEAP